MNAGYEDGSGVKRAESFLWLFLMPLQLNCMMASLRDGVEEEKRCGKGREEAVRRGRGR